MDIWGGLWLLLALLCFPFGYKPTIFLLCFSSIFQASKIFTIGGTNIPLFFIMEIFTILRLSLPIKNSGIIKFNNINTILIFFLIFLLWFHAFMMTYIFQGLKVFSSAAGSNENSVFLGGVPLKWGGSNINQLVLITVHLITALVFYCRRNLISNIFLINSVTYTSIFYFLISMIWFLYPSLYSIISNIFLNNDNYSLTAIYESRLSGTFAEPSLAGLYISSIIIPFLLYGNLLRRFLGVLFIFLGIINISSTFIFSFIISIFLVFFLYKHRIDQKILVLMLLCIVVIGVYLLFNDLIVNYVSEKSLSTSGEIRRSVNLHAINNIYNSYFFGLGLGSERPSSTFIIFFNNLGLGLTFYLVYTVYKLVNRKFYTKQSMLFFISFLTVFIGSFSSIQELTIPTLWMALFLLIINDNSVSFKSE
ncbi:hypothetical protein [uncultured Acinetobacter sp.]|uniref:hypothetical protein n=1 Tax=uncultured Acinetobacter sp. TaxID=165433 RepID=UPI00258804C8|nr:hypothetical protein [uncultured Acinetobacter sp.]